MFNESFGAHEGLGVRARLTVVLLFQSCRWRTATQYLAPEHVLASSIYLYISAHCSAVGREQIADTTLPRPRCSPDNMIMASTLLFALGMAAPNLAAPDAAQGFSARSIRAAAMRTNVGAPMLSPSNSTASLFFINNTHVVAKTGHLSELIKLDLATGKMTKITTTIPSLMDYVSASVVCGNTFYAVATSAPVAVGLAAIDLTTGNLTVHQTENILMHALACGSAPGKLLAVESVADGPPPTFTLREYDVATESSTVLYTFPKSTLWGGWDSTFSFASPGELWATFPIGTDILKQTKGELYIVDTATGALKEHKKLGGLLSGPGEPYMVFPSSGDKFSWLLAKNGASTAAEDLVMCEADKSGSAIKVSGCVKAAALWSVGSVPAICGDTAYIGVGHGETVPICKSPPLARACTSLLYSWSHQCMPRQPNAGEHAELQIDPL